jgi:nitroreductase
MEKWKNRLAEFPCDPEFLTRISSRAFDEHKPLDKSTLMSCFEAARWAPSSYNNQPWRYVYAYRGSKSYELIGNTLVDFNKLWALKASVLVVVISRTLFSHNNKPSSTASLDTGASYMSFSLEAHKRGLMTHAMEGFNHDELRQALHIPEIFKVECLLAVGHPGNIESLSAELKEKESPTQRRSLKEMVFEDHFHIN